MLVVKPVLGLLLVAALGAMWLHRGPVVDAYRAQPTATAVQLSGIDLDHDLTEVGPSPFTLPVAADGRHRAPALTPVASSTGGGPVRLTGGSARLSGVVAGPEGPLAGATVRVERHTAAGRTSRDLTTGADGGWGPDRPERRPVPGPSLGSRWPDHDPVGGALRRRRCRP